MQEVTIDELYELAQEARERIWEQARANGRAPKVYVHWTAGHYYQKFDGYHVNITGDGKLWLAAPLDEVLPHTWRRNSGSVGIALCCAYNANTESLESEPPTPAQIESAAQAIDVIAEGLWLTINKTYVMTHGEAADNEDGLYCHDPYGPKSTVERWDLEYLGTSESPSYNPNATDGSRGGDVLRGKANWYRNIRHENA